ncbi:glycoside hydrolase family 99-like domain-containing protein [Asticcacaulis sp. BYS171W]|uniref:Glycoside hydrolase family 99-like domain-containing protein n=1 Tax=Asticcacaulis aquaticus TaxID=2984212 RepID=A0ABT5HS23_9CAUL|nr:glycoside hydrolase family 99-like domain-containing protein [Asticcacaulis aquaticus]MDC7682863.1 glycoside hydrolase family 99-like domain-containing protein [Asticcacaulis aquaticus]
MRNDFSHIFLSKIRKIKASALFMNQGAITNYFDLAFYNSQLETPFPTVRQAYEHYSETGWRLLLDPSEAFCTADYLRMYEDVAATNVNPLLHYIAYGKSEGRLPLAPIEPRQMNETSDAAPSPNQLIDETDLDMESVDIIISFIDLDFYNSQLDQKFSSVNEAASHYLKFGADSNLDPSREFSTELYLDVNSDVAKEKMNPLLHYISYGKSEGRVAFTSTKTFNPDVTVITDLYIVKIYLDVNFYNKQLSGAHLTQDDAAAHYLSQGWKEGLDPSPTFSTSGYLGLYADVLEAGMNPVLHFYMYGRSEGRQMLPSAVSFGTEPELSTDLFRLAGKFDVEFYNRQLGKTLDIDEAIEHYLNRGWRDLLDPSENFSTSIYLDLHPDVRESGMNPLVHYIDYGISEGRATGSSKTMAFNKMPDSQSDVTTTDAAAAIPSWEVELILDHIDAEFYGAQLNDANLSNEMAARHYLAIGWADGLDPNQEFCTDDYLYMYPDIAATGVNPFLHYTANGKSEGRKPKSTIPTKRREKPQEILDYIKSKGTNGKSEWMDYGYTKEKAGYTLEDRKPDPESIEFTVNFSGINPVEALETLDLSKCATRTTSRVDISIIIPTINESLALVECLASIGKASTEQLVIEIIVVDNASTDALYEKIKSHPHLQYIRFDENVGFGNACNAGAEAARGHYVFFLNNDAQISPGCLESLVRAKEATLAGIVGPKILSFDGTLQEAGCFLNMDGTGSLIGYGYNPSVPRFNYTRKVEHVSGAAILLERSLFLELQGFDPIYAPAYCEDADLSLKVRAAGYDIVYEPNAVVAHHLSKTSDALGDKARSKRQRISKNRQTFVSRWSKSLAKNDLRTIAFYLPQYHTTPENNLWWGNGFTEWTNSTRARPNFEGHLQPRSPADLGYYDLRVAEVMEQQANLAKRYGLSGFCYYYYSFDGKRMLETPIENMLQTGRPDFPFCLCWANENWTKRWDGHGKDVLLKQSYSEESTVIIAKDLMRYCRSKNYITIDGKPLILIYRVKELPNPIKTIATWRSVARSEGIGEVIIASVESFELSSTPEDPKIYGCDISVEFPPHDMVQSPPLDVTRINPDWTGTVHDYRELVANYMTRVEPSFKRIRSVLVGWDNTPRYAERSMILEKATPGAFQAWLEWSLKRTLEQNYGDERIVFINAWNEWCEGSYLEPDQYNGHGHLQALKNAISNVEAGGYNFV